jgi:hypothetical protein
MLVRSMTRPVEHLQLTVEHQDKQVAASIIILHVATPNA